MMFCIPFLHDWSKWRDYAETKGGNLIQERRCRNCGKSQRRLSSPW